MHQKNTQRLQHTQVNKKGELSQCKQNILCYLLRINEKSDRTPMMAYKEDDIGLLKALQIKYASVDSQTR